MESGRYVFEGAVENRELERLRAIESIFDPATRRLMSATGDWSGRHGLEVGAGAGSMVSWMSSQVGATGRVVAVDLDVRFLGQLAGDVQVLCTDVREADLPAAGFDVAHARYVLIHNADAGAVLDALVRCLKPGGWLIVEEPDFTSARCVSGPEPLALGFDRVNQAILSMFTKRGMNPTLGRSLADLVTAREIEVVSFECDAHLARGGSPLAGMMGLSTAQLADKYVATERASAEDIDAYGAFSSDPECWGVYYSTFRVLGRK